MSAALAIDPANIVIAVKPVAVSGATGTGDGFSQALRDVRNAASEADVPQPVTATGKAPVAPMPALMRAVPMADKAPLPAAGAKPAAKPAAGVKDDGSAEGGMAVCQPPPVEPLPIGLLAIEQPLALTPGSEDASMSLPVKGDAAVSLNTGSAADPHAPAPGAAADQAGGLGDAVNPVGGLSAAGGSAASSTTAAPAEAAVQAGSDMLAARSGLEARRLPAQLQMLLPPAASGTMRTATGSNPPQRPLPAKPVSADTISSGGNAAVGSGQVTPAAAVLSGLAGGKPADGQDTFAPVSPVPEGSAAVVASERKSGLRQADEGPDAAPLPARADVSPAFTTPVFTQSPVTSDVAAPVAAPAAPPAPVSVAGQVAPALLTMAKSSDGSQQMTVRLHPADLGMVQVRIERAATGTAQVQITVEKAATLEAMQRDQSQLHLTLDQAGVPTLGRTISFHLVQPPTASGDSPGAAPNGGQHGSGGQGNPATMDADGSPGGGRNGSPAREAARAGGAMPRDGLSTLPAAAAAAETAVYRIGLNITA